MEKDFLNNNATNQDNFIQKDMETALSDAFLEYAGYNIQRRGVPDARDGLNI